MTKEQKRIKNRFEQMEKCLKGLNKEIELLKNRIKAKESQRGRLCGEICRLRDGCEHDYKKITKSDGVLGTCMICGKNMWLKDYSRDGAHP